MDSVIYTAVTEVERTSFFIPCPEPANHAGLGAKEVFR